MSQAEHPGAAPPPDPRQGGWALRGRGCPDRVPSRPPPQPPAPRGPAVLRAQEGARYPLTASAGASGGSPGSGTGPAAPLPAGSIALKSPTPASLWVPPGPAAGRVAFPPPRMAVLGHHGEESWDTQPMWGCLSSVFKFELGRK